MNQKSGEIFSPPYLFKGPRPVDPECAGEQSTTAPTFDITTPDAARIASVALIRNGVGHAQRRCRPALHPADVHAQRHGTLTLDAPANPNSAPPGYYMLWIVDTNGVPSVSTQVQLPLGPTPPPDTTPPTVDVTAPAASATVAGTDCR